MRTRRVFVTSEEGRATHAVEAEGLTKSFGSLVAVDHVDLRLEPGRIYGLLGPNGSGKTTLIRLLLGLTRPNAGHAVVLGTRVPSRPLLARIGYMPQGEGIYPELSVAENIAFFAGLASRGSPDRERSVLELVQLADRRTTPALELSGGMRRRLSLACALVHDPELLMLDEPTVGVDPALRVEFWDHFRALATEGRTFLVSSHVMDEADRCDELLLVRAGRIIDRGSSREIRERAGVDDLEAAFLALGGAGT
jgi:ABC-2 type transport system ATP-binding protein